MRYVLLLLSLVFVPQVGAQTSPSRGEPWTCSLDNIGATLTLCKANQDPALKLYITDIFAQSTTATAGLMLIQYGTGANCGTGTTSLFPSSASVPRIVYPSNALFTGGIAFNGPLIVPGGKDLCVLGTVTNTVTIQMIGYMAPAP